MIEDSLRWDGVTILVDVCLATAGGKLSECKADKAFELLKRGPASLPDALHLSATYLNVEVLMTVSAVYHNRSVFRVSSVVSANVATMRTRNSC